MNINSNTVPLTLNKSTTLIKAVVLALSMSLISNVAIAATEYVDSFDTNQAKLEDNTANGSGIASSVLTGGGDLNGIIGGERDLFISLLSKPISNSSGVRAHVTGGLFSFAVDAANTATATIQWDGIDGSPDLNYTGLGGIDITHGGTVDSFKIDALNGDHAFEFRISVYKNSTDFTQVTLLTLDNPPQITSVPFSLFTTPALCGNAIPAENVVMVTCGGDGADLADIGALQVEIDPDGKAVAVDLIVNSVFFEVPDGPLACRVTAGLHDTWTPEQPVDLIRELMIDDTSQDIDNYGDYNFYTAGGQAGAHTGQQPQPSGEWTHTQHRGAAGMFTFHGGTKSAPEGTEVDVIRCSDPGGCSPSGNPPSPVKQIDFDGIGTFKNLGKGKKSPMWLGASRNVTAEGKGNKDFAGTFHWFEVNMDDLGEPGNKDNGGVCPALGFGEKGSEALADCDCADFYRITIYDGVSVSMLPGLKNPDGSIDKSKLPHAPGDIIYQVWGYIDGGNLQIHHPTGFDNP